jgi:peptidoglycan/LPS O-acetylase OafA/YrhL
LLFAPHLAEMAVTTLGAGALFWLAFKARLGRLQTINDHWDISYGVYLYGWPIAALALWLDRGISPWLLAATTLPLAMLSGAASWWLLERWTKDLLPSRSTPLDRAQSPVSPAESLIA